MTEMKKPEDAVRVIMDALAFLEKTKVKAVRPVPVLKDKYGRLTKDYTLKLWLLKLHEELLAFEFEVTSCCNLDDNPKNYKEMYEENKALIAGEACDIITVLIGILSQFGIDDNYMDTAMIKTVEKNQGRGYFDEQECREI